MPEQLRQPLHDREPDAQAPQADVVNGTFMPAEVDPRLARSITVRALAKAPITVENFLKYVDSGFYNNTIFHRVIPGFMIQGGGFTQQMSQKDTKDPIKNEASNGLHNTRGTLSMARTSNPNSATSQFLGLINFRWCRNHGRVSVVVDFPRIGSDDHTVFTQFPR